MEEKITAKEFDDAVKKVMEEFLNDEEIDGAASVIVPLTGAMFASKMKNILFKEKEN